MIKGMKRFSVRRFSVRNTVEKEMNDFCNIPPKMLELVDRNLIRNRNHPLGILKGQIQKFFINQNCGFQIHDYFSPVVSTQACFDDLLVPKDHISRAKTDTYYVNENTILRAHTSAHQKQLIEGGENAFCVFGDVYRRDSIDSTHYPAFHQMEAVRIFGQDLIAGKSHEEAMKMNVDNLKLTLEQLVEFLFGKIEMRWVDAYFPFTDPSFELEILFKGEWLEMLGCGSIHPQLMRNWKREKEIGWAAGLGLERFAMLLFDIHDIRYFWSEDSRFLDQFQEGKFTKFQPYSKYPVCYKDISFWILETSQFSENDFFEVVRGIAGDLVEKVECIDVFEDKKKCRTSKCFRIHYRSLDKTLLNSEIDVFQFKIRDEIEKLFKVELR